MKDKLYRYRRKFLLSFVLPFPYRRLRLWALRKCGFKVGKNVYVADGLSITIGYADRNILLSLEDRVSIAPNVTLILASHPNNSRLKPYLKPKKRSIIIHKDAWIGAGAIILPDVEIGECSIVAAGAVVTHSVPPFSVVAGNPARKIKTIEYIE